MLTKDKQGKLWHKAYQQGMTMWEPQESIVVFGSRYLKRREGVASWSVRRRARRILDLGCGNGSNAHFFARQGYQVAGVDIAPSAIALAKRWFEHDGLKGDFRVGVVNALPWKDRTFDAAVSHGVLDHMTMEVAQGAAAELRRVLKPRGLLFLTLVAANDDAYGRGERVGRNTFVLADGAERGLPQHYFERDEIVGLLKGFRLLDLRRAELAYGPRQRSRHARWQVTAELKT